MHVPALLVATLSLSSADPSLAPLKDITGREKFVERWRLLTDLDGDGNTDMMLSHPFTFSNSTGSWAVYLSRKGEFTRVGDFDAHPGAIAIEPDQDRVARDPEQKRYARIWVYLRGGGGSGRFGYYRVGEGTVDEFESVEIYTSDGGTILGNAIYDAAFKKRSPIPFTMEYSATDDDGTVTWKKSER